MIKDPEQTEDRFKLPKSIYRVTFTNVSLNENIPLDIRSSTEIHDCGLTELRVMAPKEHILCRYSTDEETFSVFRKIVQSIMAYGVQPDNVEQGNDGGEYEEYANGEYEEGYYEEGYEGYYEEGHEGYYEEGYEEGHEGYFEEGYEGVE